MQLGSWQLDVLSGGNFRLDGGAMFGVVPKSLWQRAIAPDAENLIPMATNCLLARDGRHTVLIDTGYGGKCSPREQQVFHLESGEPLLASLAALGLAPEEIDTVIFSHLHFDHAGGGTRRDPAGRICRPFPGAIFRESRRVGNRRQPRAELRGSYPPDNLLPLAEAGCLTLVDGDMELVPGISSLVTGGHTAGHQSILIRSGRETAIYLGDLCPTTAHLRPLWCMAYDVYPLDTRRRKPLLLGQAAQEGWLLFWDHDPLVSAGRLLPAQGNEFQVLTP